MNSINANFAQSLYFKGDQTKEKTKQQPIQREPEAKVYYAGPMARSTNNIAAIIKELNKKSKMAAIAKQKDMTDVLGEVAKACVRNDAYCNPDEVLTMVRKESEFVYKLSQYKDSDGNQLLNPDEISLFLYNLHHSYANDSKILNCKAKTLAVLNNPKEIELIEQYKNRAAGVWRAVQDPLTSTLISNPGAFLI